MQKKYRPNVAAVILSSSYPFKCEILVAKRVDMDDIWQFPQGGIDEGESPKQALKRELKEEIGTDKFSEYKFVDINKALEVINHFKKPIYDKVLSYFKEKGYF